MWVAADVLVGEDKLIHGVAVVAAEPVAPIVAAAAELRLAGLGVNEPLIGPNAKIAPANVKRLSGLDRARPSAAVAVGTVDPVVQTPNEAIDTMLGITRMEAGEERLTNIRWTLAG